MNQKLEGSCAHAVLQVLCWGNIVSSIDTIIISESGENFAAVSAKLRLSSLYR